MLSFGEMVVLAVGMVFFLGRKEGMRMINQSGRTLGKFWKVSANPSHALPSHCASQEMSKDGKTVAKGAKGAEKVSEWDGGGWGGLWVRRH
jgi:hypothetical protein